MLRIPKPKSLKFLRASSWISSGNCLKRLRKLFFVEEIIKGYVRLVSVFSLQPLVKSVEFAASCVLLDLAVPLVRMPFA